MAKFAILRISRLKNPGAILASGQHAFRERNTPNADPEATWANEVNGASSSEAVLAAVTSRIKEIAAVDKQATLCVEYLITASPDQFRPGGTIRGRWNGFFEDSLKWVKEKHGAENVVSSVVHKDETTPHMTVYVVPVVQREACTRKRSVSIKGGGRVLKEFAVPARSELSGKHFFGDRRKLADMQTDFAERVGKSYGLERGKHRAIGDERIDHKSIKQFWTEMDAIKKEIEAQAASLEASRGLLDEDMRLLEVDRAALAKERYLLARVRGGLDQREVDLKSLEDGLISRVMAEKIEPLNAAILAFKQDRAAFRKELAIYLDTTKGYTPGQIKAALTALDKVKSQTRGM